MASNNNNPSNLAAAATANASASAEPGNLDANGNGNNIFSHYLPSTPAQNPPPNSSQFSPFNLQQQQTPHQQLQDHQQQHYFHATNPAQHDQSSPNPQQLAYQQISDNVQGNGDPQNAQDQPQAVVATPRAPRPRLGKACDLCSSRKVRCDNGDPSCLPCAALGVPCTKTRVARRRGPPNKNAIAHKHKHERSDGLGELSPESPNNIAATLASLSTQAVLNAESIVPFPTLILLVDEFFTYIHPLTPFPHEQTFRAALDNRDNLSNPTFLALLASMVGALVASSPRKPHQILSAAGLDHKFPSSLSFIEHCHKVAIQARGPGYLDRHLMIYDAITSYFLALAAVYTYQKHRSELYFAEAFTIWRIVGIHYDQDSGREPSTDPSMGLATDRGSHDLQRRVVDYVQQEESRRLFWVMIAGVRSLEQIGGQYSSFFIPPPTLKNPYPPLPVEVDDQFIFSTHIAHQPPGLISKITGFNVGAKLYNSITELATLETCNGIDEVFDWARQKNVLDEVFDTIHRVIATLPADLQLMPSSQLSQFENSHHHPSGTNYATIAPYDDDTWSPASFERRRIQFEVQKANIYASQLATRSYIAEKYTNFLEAFERATPGSRIDGKLNLAGGNGHSQSSSTGPFDDIEAKVANEREIIVKEFLDVFQSINQKDIEPNGPSFINKIRQVASTLVGQPEDRKGPLALKSSGVLEKFLDILLRLDRATPNRDTNAENPEDAEEDNWRSWADLRDHQLRFSQEGGFAN